MGSELLERMIAAGAKVGGPVAAGGLAAGGAWTLGQLAGAGAQAVSENVRRTQGGMGQPDGSGPRR